MCSRTNQANGHVWEEFQRRGPAAAKARSPRRELVLITPHLKLMIEADGARWWQRAGNRPCQMSRSRVISYRPDKQTDTLTDQLLNLDHIMVGKNEREAVQDMDTFQ